MLSKGADLMAHMEVVDRWEDGNPTTVPADAKIRGHPRGGEAEPFFAIAHVDNYVLIRVQQSDDDATALTASASLASDHVRLFGPEETGLTPILAPENVQIGTPRLMPWDLPSTRTP